jgi:glycosyltransferase involved in cell wall biosynthesis
MRTRSGEVPGSRGSAEAATPFISVVVTAYHRMDFLLEAVRSVLVQDLERSSFEVIVLKDFVRPDIEAELARSSPPIRAYTEELGTMGEMIARGIDLARGEVVCFLEDDDRFLPGKLRGLSDLFHGTPELGFVRNSYRGIDARGRSLASWDRDRPQTQSSVILSDRSPPRASVAFVYQYGAHVNLSTMAIRTDLARPWTSYLRQLAAVPDLFLFELAAISGRPIRVESSAWTEYRVHQSTSHAALDGGSEAKALAETYRSYAAALVMEGVLRRAPGHEMASRFVVGFVREQRVTLYLLDPDASLTPAGWMGFVRTIAWRRQRYLVFIAMFAAFRRVSPKRSIAAYRNWRFKALRRSAEPNQ